MPNIPIKLQQIHSVVEEELNLHVQVVTKNY